MYCEADLQTKPGAKCCHNRTADPAALGEAEVDDRPTAMRGLLPSQWGRVVWEVGLEVTASS